jgi:uncharacterized protein
MSALLVAREMSLELRKMAVKYPVVTVLGPRQSGKSTLVRREFPDKPYVSLEDLDERGFAESDPRGFLERFVYGAVLDEIQRAPQLLSYIQGIVDERDEKGFFILTGSHQLELHESVTQLLAGRTAILKLLPLSIAELRQSQLAFSLDNYIYHGMYPRIYKDEINSTKFYRDYVQTYVERDVPKMVNVKDLSLFQHFLKLCAGRVGQIFNSHGLSNELGVSHHTVNNWLSILEASFLIFKLQPYFENFGKRIIKSPKIYFTDTGLAAYLLDITSVEQVSRDPLRGGLVENLVISEFMKSRFNKGYEPSFYFYRDSNGREVDLIFKSGNNLIPIEIKSSRTFHSDFLQGIKYFKKIAGDRSPTGILIYSGDQEQVVDGVHVYNYKNVERAMEVVVL